MKRINVEKTNALARNFTAPASETRPSQEAWNQQLNHTAELYGKLLATMRDEVTGFVQKRVDANIDTARAWTTCRSMSELLELQQKWLQCAVEHYTEQGLKMAEICQQAMSEPGQESAQAGPPAETEQPKPAAERKAGAEHRETSVPHAA